jgi:trigger factor
VKSAVETLSPTRVKLTVEVPFEELQGSFDAAYATIAKQVNVPGFRKGKVPARVLEQRFGRAVILEEAINDALPKAYDEAIRTNSITPVGRPEVDVTSMADGQALEFTAEVDVRPEFDLPVYGSVRVVVDPIVVSDEDVREQVDALRTRFATLKDVDRAGADGDLLLVDIAGHTPDGDPVEDLSGQALSYELGTEGLLPGFDEAVRGAAKGEQRTFEFTPMNGDWSGVPLTVTVEVGAVRERELPAFDDDFASMASEFDTADELRADIANRLGGLKRIEQAAQARDRVHDALLDMVEIPLPEGLVAAEVQAYFEDGHDSGEEHRAEVEQQARSSIKAQFLLDKLAEAEQVTVAEAEFSAWAMQQAPRYGMTPDAFLQALVQAGQVPMAVADIRRAKALALVLEQATVVDSEGVVVDLAAVDEEMAARRQAMARTIQRMEESEGEREAPRPVTASSAADLPTI